MEALEPMADDCLWPEGETYDYETRRKTFIYFAPELYRRSASRFAVDHNYERVRLKLPRHAGEENPTYSMSWSFYGIKITLQHTAGPSDRIDMDVWTVEFIGPNYALMYPPKVRFKYYRDE